MDYLINIFFIFYVIMIPISFFYIMWTFIDFADTEIQRTLLAGICFYWSLLWPILLFAFLSHKMVNYVAKEIILRKNK